MRAKKKKAESERCTQFSSFRKYEMFNTESLYRAGSCVALSASAGSNKNNKTLQVRIPFWSILLVRGHVGIPWINVANHDSRNFFFLLLLLLFYVDSSPSPAHTTKISPYKAWYKATFSRPIRPNFNHHEIEAQRRPNKLCILISS